LKLENHFFEGRRGFHEIIVFCCRKHAGFSQLFGQLSGVSTHGFKTKPKRWIGRTITKVIPSMAVIPFVKRRFDGVVLNRNGLAVHRRT
jgi:hypothetical protein